MYTDFRFREAPIIGKEQMLDLERFRVDMVLEGAHVKAKLVVPHDVDVLNRVLNRSNVRSILMPVEVVGRTLDRWVYETITKFRKRGVKVYLEDTYTWHIAERGGVELFPDVDYVIRRYRDKVAVIRPSDVPPYTLGESLTLADRLRYTLRGTLPWLTVRGIGNIVSVYFSPLVRQYRDLLSIDREVQKRIEMSLLVSGYVVKITRIFIRNEHSMEDVKGLREAMLQVISNTVGQVSKGHI